jgi:hypothetical protein
MTSSISTPPTLCLFSPSLLENLPENFREMQFYSNLHSLLLSFCFSVFVVGRYNINVLLFALSCCFAHLGVFSLKVVVIFSAPL